MPLKATERARSSANRHRLSSLKQFVRYRKSKVPEGGWTGDNFVGSAKKKLQQDMLFIHRSAVAQMMRTFSPKVKALMRGQINRVLDSVKDSYARLYGVPLNRDAKALAEVVVPPNVHASMWEAALEAEFARAGFEVTTTFTPAIQSVASSVSSKVGVVLGSTGPSQAQVSALGVRVKDLARKVTGINETTRKRLAATIADSIRKNRTVFETIEKVRKRVPAISDSRVATIVRTEMGRASDEATKAAMKFWGDVTHFSVIGCEAMEPNSPTLLGRSTCNIEHVPIQYEGDIFFHINHTGAIVADAFKKQDGTVPAIAPGSGPAMGDPDKPGFNPLGPLTPPPVVKPPPIPPTGPTFAGIPNTAAFNEIRKEVRKILSPEDTFKIAKAGNWTALVAEGGAQGSRAMQLAAKATKEGHPTFQPKAQFLAESKNGHSVGVMDRGVNFPDPIGNLKSATPFHGSGVYGDGYYHASLSKHLTNVEHLMDGSPTSTAASFGGRTNNSRVMAGYLKKGAKVIDYEDLRALQIKKIDELWEVMAMDAEMFLEKKYGTAIITEAQRAATLSEYKTYQEVNRALMEVYDDAGAFAKLNGYDAIIAQHGQYINVVSNKNYVLLDDVASWNSELLKFEWATP